jgi:Phosphotransferase enzyme family
MSAWEVRAEKTLSKVNFEELLSIASTRRTDSTAIEILKPLIRYGGSHVVVPIKFKDGTIWAARLANEDCEGLLGKSLNVLNYIEKNCPDVTAPRVKAADVLDNKVGVAYLLLDWIDGVSLEDWSPCFPVREDRHFILDGVADYLLSLWSCTTECETLTSAAGNLTLSGLNLGNHSLRSVTSWFIEQLDRGMRRYFNGNRKVDVIDLLIQLSLVSKYVVSEYDNGPFVLAHEDLTCRNLIVNDKFQLQGIVDWDFARFVPLQVAICFPLFIACIPGFNNTPALYASDNNDPYAADRDYFLETFRKQEVERFGEGRISSLLETSCERQFFQLSMDYAAVNHQFSQLYCARTRQTMMDALVQLERFMEREGDYSENTAVLETRQEIQNLINDL